MLRHRVHRGRDWRELSPRQQLLIGGLACAVASVVVVGTVLRYYDFIRWVVLAEIAVVFFATAADLIDRSIPNGPRLAHEYGLSVRYALIGRCLAMLVFFFGILDRIGHSDLNPLTPTVQLILIAWILSLAYARQRTVFNKPREVVEEIAEKVEAKGVGPVPRKRVEELVNEVRTRAENGES